jgi:hypothetical protein
MDMKKNRDTISSLKSQMKMVQERLNDTQYSPIWPQLKLQEQKLDIEIRNFKKTCEDDLPKSH